MLKDKHVQNPFVNIMTSCFYLISISSCCQCFTCIYMVATLVLRGLIRLVNISKLTFPHAGTQGGHCHGACHPQGFLLHPKL